VFLGKHIEKYHELTPVLLLESGAKLTESFLDADILITGKKWVLLAIRL
jgi:hypothetical protein